MSCADENDDGDRPLCSTCKAQDDQEREEAYEEEETPVSDDPIHDPTEEEQPQPSTETIHEPSPSHSQPRPQTIGVRAVEFPSGASDGNAEAVTVDVSAAQAA